MSSAPSTCRPNNQRVLLLWVGSLEAAKSKDGMPPPARPPNLRTLCTVDIAVGADRNRRGISPRKPRGRAAGGVGDGRHPLRPRAAELGGWTQALRRLLGVRVVRQRTSMEVCTLI